MKLNTIKEIYKLLASGEADELYLRLLRYAAVILRSTSIGRVLNGSPEMRPDDIVHDAFLGILEKERKIDLDKFPSLEGDIKWIIRSVIDNKIKLQKTQLDLMSADLDDDINSSDSSYDGSECIIKEQELERLLQDIPRAIKSNNMLEEIYLCFLDGIDKPQEIAEELGIDVDKVYYQKRKLIKILEPILQNKILDK